MTPTYLSHFGLDHPPFTKEIADAPGGTIPCESRPGVGTSFLITLPARVDARRSEAPHAARAVPVEG